MPVQTQQFEVLKRPLITEKSSVQMQEGVYAFEVDLNANKLQIAQAVRDVFKVKVKAVRTIRMKGRRNRRNRYGYFNESDWKKALVTLEKGESIEIT
ncbi:MAG: 50S ribosomal protein L23 [Planctomycetota bacterium]|nr:50S ribosomal protein L23 [Planctomycetota bacterium]